MMAKRSFPLSKVYGLLEPGPVLLLTTAHKGKSNVMALSWHTMMEFEPPLVGCVVSGRDFRCAQGDAAMRAQHPDRAAGEEGGGLRQYLRQPRGQVRGLRPDAAACRIGRRAADRR